MRKLLSKAIAVSVMMSTTVFSSALAAGLGADVLPDLRSAVNGKVTQDGLNMNVQVSEGAGKVGEFNWRSFNVGKDASVNFEFTSHNQTALNRVDQTGGMSQIYGRLTNSGCSGCGYAGTGKVILLNPNGVIFGSGANVDLNSFTVSSFDGKYDEAKKELTLTRQKDAGNITVMDGAKIHGNEAVNFAASNVNIYNGSKISTDVGINNFNNNKESVGKVKIVTADGVTFGYYGSGAVKQVKDLKAASDRMIIQLNGDIEAGNIDVRNYSNNENSQLNVNGANLKAVKAVKGSDGNIWLTSLNNVIIGDSTITTLNATGAENVADGGDVLIQASKKATLAGHEKQSNVNAVGNVTITSSKHDVVVDNAQVKAGKDINVNAANIAAVQNASDLNAAGNVTITGKERAQVIEGSKVTGAKVKLASDKYIWTKENSAIVSRSGDVDIEAANGKIVMKNTTVTAENNHDVNLKSAESITSTRLAGSTFTGRNVNLTSTGDSVLLTSTEQFKPATEGALNLKGAKNVEINSQGALNLKDKNYTIEAGENVFLTSANNGDVDVDNHVTFKNAQKVFVKSDKNLTIDADMNNIQTNLYSKNDMNATLANVGVREKGLIAESGHDMTITTDGDLSVSRLVSKNDMTLNAKRVLSGSPKTTEKLKEDGDSSDRAYIEVGGTFTSNPEYTVTESADRVEENGKLYDKRHHIYYQDGEGEQEEILLVNKREAKNVKPDEPDLPTNPGADDKKPIEPDDDNGNGSVTPPPTEPTDPDPTDPDPSKPTDPTDPDCKDEEGNEVVTPEQKPTVPGDESSQGGQQQGGDQGSEETNPSVPDIDTGKDKDPEPPQESQDNDKDQKEDNEDLGGGENRPDLPSDSESKTPEIDSQGDKKPANPEEASNIKYNMDNGSYIIKMEKRKL